MPQFSYKARRRTGEVVEGVLDVADRSAALLHIERLGLFPVLVDAAKGSAAAAASERPAAAKTNFRALLPPSLQAALSKKRKPKLQELATYTQQLANLLNSGMPLTVALNSMTHLESKGIPADISRDLRQDVMEGRSLSDSMAKQPRIFSDLYVNMVRAGESSGALVEVLRRMADHFERFAQVQSKFSSALVYPAFVGVVGIGIMFFFMTYMLPKFMTIFEGMNVPMPVMTQILIGISHAFARYWWLMLIVVAIAVILFKRFQASTEGRRKLDQWKMSAPVFGKVIKLNLFGQFASTLSTLLENGVPVLTALKITEQIMPNVILREAISKTREEVTDGKTLAQPLARSKVFPQLMVDLVKIGEDTGDVPGALRNIAVTYENELSIALRVMMNMIEPVMIVVMALGVGFLLLSVLSAMFAMTANIAR
ncbi:MAG TPA: type II secretion system F family protein [Candidatus Binatia bacterium]|jgi:general secretion pathway protein F|nr:type II secretion system F family protein [Candidatus Binatia bacterium]